MIKRNAVVLAIVLLLSCFPVVSQAADEVQPGLKPVDLIKNGVALFVSSPVAFVNGQEDRIESADWKVVPYEKNAQVMVPVRFIVQSLGGKVSWDENSSTVAAALDGKKISLTAGSLKLTGGGEAYQTEVPVEITKGRTFVQAGPFVRALGKKLFYDNGLIIISGQDIRINDADRQKTVHQTIMLFNKQYSSSNTDGSELETTITSDDPSVQSIIKYYEAVNEQNYIKYKNAVSPRMSLIVPDWSSIYRVLLVNIDEQKATVTKQDYLDSSFAKFTKPVDVRIFAVTQQIHRTREPMGVGYYAEAVQNFAVVQLSPGGPWAIDFIGDDI